MMSIQRAVNEFVSQGKDLYRQLRSNGATLSDVDLMTLREQLHILDAEAGHLQDLKEGEVEDSHFLFNGKRPQAPKPLSRRHG